METVSNKVGKTSWENVRRHMLSAVPVSSRRLIPWDLSAQGPWVFFCRDSPAQGRVAGLPLLISLGSRPCLGRFPYSTEVLQPSWPSSELVAHPSVLLPCPASCAFFILSPAQACTQLPCPWPSGPDSLLGPQHLVVPSPPTPGIGSVEFTFHLPEEAQECLATDFLKQSL